MTRFHPDSMRSTDAKAAQKAQLVKVNADVMAFEGIARPPKGPAPVALLPLGPRDG